MGICEKLAATCCPDWSSEQVARLLHSLDEQDKDHLTLWEFFCFVDGLLSSDRLKNLLDTAMPNGLREGGSCKLIGEVTAYRLVQLSIIGNSSWLIYLLLWSHTAEVPKFAGITSWYLVVDAVLTVFSSASVSLHRAVVGPRLWKRRY